MTDTDRYLHGHHDSVLRSHRWRTADNSAAYLVPHLEPGMTLLDIGSGPGTITADLAAAVAPGRVVAVEATAAALDLTRREVGRRGLDNVDLAVSDIQALDFDDDRFDVVHTHQVLQHVPEPVRALSEMRRVAVPGGLVAARESDYAGFTWYPQLPALEEWLALYRTVARASDTEPDAGRRLLSWALTAGFVDVTPSASVWCYATADDRSWWGGLWAERIIESSFAGKATESGVAKPEDLRRLADGWRTWATAEDGWFTVLHGEILARA